MLTNSQKEKARKWYIDHYQHVNKLLDNMDDKSIKFPPTDAEDKQRPELWKPAHWNWFLNHS